MTALYSIANSNTDKLIKPDTFPGSLICNEKPKFYFKRFAYTGNIRTRKQICKLLVLSIGRKLD